MMTSSIWWLLYIHTIHLPFEMVYIRVKNNEHLDQVRKTLMELCKYLASYRKTNMVLFHLYEASNSPIQTESRMAITWAEERGTRGVISWVQSFRFAKWKTLKICFILMWIYLLWAALLRFSSVQVLSHVRLSATPWTAAHQASLSITNSWSWLKLTSIESVMPSNHLILCHPLLLPSIFPSITVFSSESALHIRWPKYWSFSFSISPSNEHPGLISFKIDWLDLPVVQGTLKSLLQHNSSKASILQCSAFFTVQLSHPYMTTGKTIALTRWAFVGKVVSLLFNMLSKLVITFLPRNKHLLISWLQSRS